MDPDRIKKRLKSTDFYIDENDDLHYHYRGQKVNKNKRFRLKKSPQHKWED